MTRDEIKRIFLLLKVAFPAFLPESAEGIKAKIGLWEMMFPNTSYASAEWAARQCIANCTYPPTVADMNQWLGMGATRQDMEARIPIEVKPFTYPEDIDTKFQNVMRSINE